ncbi:MAG: WD40/YVTN/BNR-like repeat-containing protein, partial [Candidatus Kapaibacterium sp.]
DCKENVMKIEGKGGFAVVLFICMVLSAVQAPAQKWYKIAKGGGAAFAQNRYNESTIYGGGGSGITISRDYGDTWKRIDVKGLTNGDFTGASLGMMVMPNDTNTIILVPGSYGLHCGLVRTTDGGETWKMMDSAIVDRGAVYVISADGVVYDPDDAETYYVVEALSRRCLLRSRDRGVSYDTVVHFDSLGYGWVKYLCSGIIHPVTKEFYVGGADGVLFRSKDKGKTWSRSFITNIRPNDSLGLMKVPSIKFCKKSPNIGYATITQGIRDSLDINLYAAGLYKTTDYGDSWNRIAFAMHSMWALDVKEEDDGSIHVATGSYWNSLDSGLVAYSSDGGTTWDTYVNSDIPWFYFGNRSSYDILITPRKSPFYNSKRLILGTAEGAFYLGWGSTSSAPELVSPPTAPVRIFRSGNECTVRVTTDQNLDGARVHVYNVAGGEVLSYSPEVLPFSSTDFEFRLPAPVPGAYYLVIRSSAGSYTAPFIVN